VIAIARTDEAGTMPGHNGFRFDDYESISPARVCPPQRRPKEPVHATEPGSRLLSFEDSELLPESSGFQCKPVARYHKARMYVTTAMTSEPIALMLVEQPSMAAINPDPLILLTDQVLMTHRSPYPLVNRIRLLN
jgi:hypothetical protein